METKFYMCPVCGSIIVKVCDTGINPVCCGQEMKELKPADVDASKEAHVPTINVCGPHRIKVHVGAVPHPMTEEHRIVFVCLETEHGFRISYLHPECEPEVLFAGIRDKPVAVYAYCNKHGLWKTEIKCGCDESSCKNSEEKYCR